MFEKAVVQNQSHIANQPQSHMITEQFGKRAAAAEFYSYTVYSATASKHNQKIILDGAMHERMDGWVVRVQR